MLEGIALAAAASAISVVTLAIVRRGFGADRLKELNDITGFYFTLIGTIYAVILAFMVFAVWTDYQVADGTVEKEANAAISIARTAYGYPRDTHQAMVPAVLAYVRSAIDDEWPAMSHQKESAVTRSHMDGMWTAALALHPETMREQVLLQQVLSSLGTLREARRSRLLKSQSDLPRILWDLLLLGGGVTLFGSLFFGVRNFKYHAFQTVLLATTIAMVLFVLQSINHPYRGEVRVEPDALREAARVIEGLQRTEGAVVGEHRDDPKEERPSAVAGTKR